MELVVPPGQEKVKSLADLKGKTIAVGKASEAYPALIRLLNKAKLRPTDVTIKDLPAETLTQVFQQKDRLADAVFESRHFYLGAAENQPSASGAFGARRHGETRLLRGLHACRSARAD